MKEKGLPFVASAKKGQALIILIVAIAIAITIVTSTTLLAVGQAKASLNEKLGRKVYYAAEAGNEYALVKLIRNPNSCAGTDIFTRDSVLINVAYNLSGGRCVVTSEAKQNNIVKKIKVEAWYNTNRIFETCCWQEIT